MRRSSWATPPTRVCPSGRLERVARARRVGTRPSVSAGVPRRWPELLTAEVGKRRPGLRLLLRHQLVQLDHLPAAAGDGGAQGVLVEVLLAQEDGAVGQGEEETGSEPAAELGQGVLRVE